MFKDIVHSEMRVKVYIEKVRVDVDSGEMDTLREEALQLLTKDPETIGYNWTDPESENMVTLIEGDEKGLYFEFTGQDLSLE